MLQPHSRTGRSAELLLVGLALAGAAVVGLALLLTGGDEPASRGEPDVALPGPSVVESGGAPDPVAVVALEEVGPEVREEDLRYGPTTVLWPLEVHLDLVRPAVLPDVPGTPLGSGNTARMRGRIADIYGDGAQATIEFVGGPNRGRALTTGADGSFGANDLYPGLDIVTVTGPSILGSKREIVLRQGKETLLNIAYGQPGGAQGRVLDARNEKVAGATVTIDGQSTLTDASGDFYLPRIAAGAEVLVEIDHPDYAPFRSEMGIARSFVAEASRMVFNLEDPASLVLELGADIGGPGPAQVVLVPTHGGMNRSYPWYRVNPIALGPAPVTIERLPPGSFHVYAFRPGAVGDPPRSRLTLTAGETRAHVVGLRAAPTVRGRVVDDGQVVPGATVRLVAADPVRATLDVFREESLFLEAEVLPPLPAARQEVRADVNGEFVLTGYGERSAWRLLEAVDPAGERRAVLAIGPDDEQVEVELEPVAAGHATLQLLLSGRFQSLPVQVVVDGRPREPFELPPDRDLELDDLAAGTWDLRVTWWAEELLQVDGLRIEDVTQRSLTLPDAARTGQDRETWMRAGRRWPLD